MPSRGQEVQISARFSWCVRGSGRETPSRSPSLPRDGCERMCMRRARRGASATRAPEWSTLGARAPGLDATIALIGRLASSGRWRSGRRWAAGAPIGARRHRRIRPRAGAPFRGLAVPRGGLLRVPCPGSGLTRAAAALIAGDLGCVVELSPLSPVILRGQRSQWQML
jgi:hypothetical protein